MTDTQRKFLIDHLTERANYHYQLWGELRAEYDRLYRELPRSQNPHAVAAEMERLETAAEDAWEAARALFNEVDYLE